MFSCRAPVATVSSSIACSEGNARDDDSDYANFSVMSESSGCGKKIAKIKLQINDQILNTPHKFPNDQYNSIEKRSRFQKRSSSDASTGDDSSMSNISVSRLREQSEGVKNTDAMATNSNNKILN